MDYLFIHNYIVGYLVSWDKVDLKWPHKISHSELKLIGHHFCENFIAHVAKTIGLNRVTNSELGNFGTKVMSIISFFWHLSWGKELKGKLTYRITKNVPHFMKNSNGIPPGPGALNDDMSKSSCFISYSINDECKAMECASVSLEKHPLSRDN